MRITGCISQYNPPCYVQYFYFFLSNSLFLHAPNSYTHLSLLWHKSRFLSLSHTLSVSVPLYLSNSLFHILSLSLSVYLSLLLSYSISIPLSISLSFSLSLSLILFLFFTLYLSDSIGVSIGGYLIFIH